MNITPSESVPQLRFPGSNPAVKTGGTNLSRGDSDRLEIGLRAGAMDAETIRPEVVERGKRLAEDPNYPGPAAMDAIAQNLVGDLLG